MNINAITTTQEAQKGFYPTPPELADKLLAGIDWHYVATVLEPSAGKGDLVKAVAQKAHSLRYGETLSVDCVEIDPYLRSILEYEFGGRREDEIRERRKQLNDKEGWNAVTRTEGELTPMEAAEKRRLEREYDWLHKLSAPVVHDDFLTFQSRKRYDLIVMNPPFADGDAAWAAASAAARDAALAAARNAAWAAAIDASDAARDEQVAILRLMLTE